MSPAELVGRENEAKRKWANGPWRLLACCRGAAAMEFALLTLPLIWVLGVLVETAAFITVQFQLQFASERAARLLRTNQIPSTVQVDGFKAAVCERLTIANCSRIIHVDVRHSSTFALLNAPSVTAIGPSRPGSTYVDIYAPGTSGDAGSLIVTYDWKFIFPFMGTYFGFANVPGRSDIRRLYGSAVYMTEMM